MSSSSWIILTPDAATKRLRNEEQERAEAVPEEKRRLSFASVESDVTTMSKPKKQAPVKLSQRNKWLLRILPKKSSKDTT